jgi:response regulator RpfG family c-di-GMP phosphodiesterase
MIQAMALDVMESAMDLMAYPAPNYPKSISLADDSLNVLMVEDIYSDATIIKIALDAAKIPYELSKIRRGDNVLPHLRISRMVSQLPDIILMDLGLPGMDGFEVLAEMDTLPASIRHIPIVILTAHKHFEYIQDTYPSLHIIGYMNKPCSPSDIRPFLVKARHERNRQNIH